MTNPPSRLIGQVAGHPMTSAAVAGGSAAAATVLAGPFTAGGVMMAAAFAMVPVLWDANTRRGSEEKVRDAIQEIREELSNHPEQVRDFSEQQLGFVSETVASLASSYDAEKIGYLKNAVLRASKNPGLVLENSGFLARILRDITAQEMNYIARNFSTRLAVLAPNAESHPGDAHIIEQGSEEEGMVAALLSLGLVRTSSSGPFDFDYYDWTRLAGKLLALIRSN